MSSHLCCGKERLPKSRLPKVLHKSRKQKLWARTVCRVCHMCCRSRVHASGEEPFLELPQNGNKWKIVHKLGGNFCIEQKIQNYAGLSRERF